MNFARFSTLFGCCVVLCARGQAEERNNWPGHVAQVDATNQVTSWESLGPLVFEKPAVEVPGTVGGVRPFFVRTVDLKGMTTEATSLYPIFIYRADAEQYRWSVFNLINHTAPKYPAGVVHVDQIEAFEVWPFYFSRQTGSPESSYRALFPIAGKIHSRFTYDELAWILWPLYFRTEKSGAITDSTPWPILRFTHGTEHGFAFWPLFGWRDRPDRFHRSFYLWPLGWDNTLQPAEDAAAGTPVTRQIGALPFYSRETRPGYIDECYLWPFFGYTNRTQPTTYHETRYFWPFLVQGRGERYVNRWGPFYTHSIVKGTDKKWYMWPLLKRTSWADAGIEQMKTQFLFAVYFSVEQRSAVNPAAAPADRTHLWPLFSKWDNGAGRRQFQLFSPFDVFFPTNERVREAWTPLFAIYRSDVRAPDDHRWSILWNAVTWRREQEKREFHLGPLVSVTSGTAAARVALGNGILGWKRDSGSPGWHLFWFDFPDKSRKVSTALR